MVRQQNTTFDSPPSLSRQGDEDEAEAEMDLDEGEDREDGAGGEQRAG